MAKSYYGWQSVACFQWYHKLHLIFPLRGDANPCSMLDCAEARISIKSKPDKNLTKANEILEKIKQKWQF
jgi:hypothetical protein